MVERQLHKHALLNIFLGFWQLTSKHTQPYLQLDLALHIHPSPPMPADAVPIWLEAVL